jgi:4-diphosphocytidyl-2-C-methyl-D-erythritol kinase
MLTRFSPCKINLLLNVLGRRSDGFHELETVFFPVQIGDELKFSQTTTPGVSLTCNHPDLPLDQGNLVYQAAAAFLAAQKKIPDSGVRIHLEKRLPLAAGLGGGSSNAAQVLRALNELFDFPLSPEQLHQIAATLGSDVNFFLQDNPALATGRGEHIVPIDFPSVLQTGAVLLYHPGFGVSTPWAYQQLARYPDVVNGRPGRAQELVRGLNEVEQTELAALLFNAFEVPVFEKFPILKLYQEFWKSHGAWAALMSGSGSTSFALFADEAQAFASRNPFEAEFGKAGWMEIVSLNSQGSA